MLQDTLRFATAGSVDDGKSTLIGRLLYDSHAIKQDTLEALQISSERQGSSQLDLALLTDGLRAEREQGITIDVAYRYFSTAKRKFILADSPGHVQYTRNMVTATSTAQAVLLLVDARKGIVEQTRRHTFITSLMQIKHLVVCINKMDLVNYAQEVYDTICADFQALVARMPIPNVQFVPLSATVGDNVVSKSDMMPWYEGPTLLYQLEHLHLGIEQNLIDPRFPVQSVIRPPQDYAQDYRGYAGRIASGVFKVGDTIIALPSGFSSQIVAIDGTHGEQAEAFAPQSVTIRLKDEIDISRGDMLAKPNNHPIATQDLDVMVCWLHITPLELGKKYLLMHTHKQVRCMVKELIYTIDLETLHRVENPATLQLNDLGRIRLRTTQPLFVDTYDRNKVTGSLILIDEQTNATVAACMIKQV